MVRHACVGVALVALLGGTTSAATTIEVTPFDLAANKLPKSVGSEHKQTDCTVKADGSFDCAQLARTTKSMTIGDLTIQLVAKPAMDVTYTLAGETVTFTATPPLSEIAVLGPAGWTIYKLENGALKDKDVAPRIKPDAVVWGKTSSSVTPLKLTEGRAALGLPADRKDLTCPDVLDSWCSAQAPGEHVCVDATQGFTEILPPRANVIPPNTSVTVVVRHYDNVGLVISQQGTRGLFEPGVENYVGTTILGAKAQGEKLAVPACKTLTRRTFVPRTPGSADIKIELHKLDDKSLIADHTIELEVARTYGGAIRLGVSTIRGKAVQREYANSIAPGSSTREIASTLGGDTNIEVVVGISAYVYDLIANRGRNYVDRGAQSYLVPSPYFGVGIVSAKGSGLTNIPSAHFGLEWEFSKSFAISLDGVARKVTRLDDGFFVGSPVGASTVFTQDRFEWGWAFTISTSPEFLQLALGSQP